MARTIEPDRGGAPPAAGLEAGPSSLSGPGGCPRRRIISIRHIVAAAAGLITALAVAGVGLVGERNTRRSLTAELEMRLLLESRNLALGSSSALLTDLPEMMLHPLVRKMQDAQPEIGLAVVIDHQGLIQGSGNPRDIDRPFVPPPLLRPAPPSQPLNEGELFLADSELLVASAPVRDLAGREIGRALVGVRRRYVDTLLADARRQQMIVTLVVLLIGVASALILMSGLLRPVARLRRGLERIGQGDLDTRLDIREATEFGMLADTVNDMTLALRRAQVEMVEKERLAHEVALAHEIQDSLLPTRRTVAGTFVVQGTHRAAAEVGGDYFDILPLPGARLAVTVADVAGKGLGGCLVMSMLSVLLRAFKDSYDSPSALLVRLDERLSESLRKGSFVTMFYGIIDPTTGRMTFASAGHSPTLVYRRGTGLVERIGGRGIPLGAMRGGVIRRTLNDEALTLEPGDMLLQYTDGLYEAFNPAGEQLGIDRLAAVLEGEARRGCEAVLTAQRRHLDDWLKDGRRQDDETLLVVSREIAVPVEAPETSRVGAASTASPAGRAAAGEASGSPPVLTDPLERLEEARRRGERIRMAVDLARLDDLSAWVGARAPLNRLPAARLNLIVTAIYEACANIIEHGHKGMEGQQLELWWVPPAGAPAGVPPAGIPPAGAPPAGPPRGDRSAGSGCASDPDAHGFFLIRDQGRAFSADNWKATNFFDPEVRRRGRGFGLDIIHRAVNPIVYGPGTPEGNVTMLVFDTKPDVMEASANHG